jgi:hypothetical protein
MMKYSIQEFEEGENRVSIMEIAQSASEVCARDIAVAMSREYPEQVFGVVRIQDGILIMMLTAERSRPT